MHILESINAAHTIDASEIVTAHLSRSDEAAHNFTLVWGIQIKPRSGNFRCPAAVSAKESDHTSNSVARDVDSLVQETISKDLERDESTATENVELQLSFLRSDTRTDSNGAPIANPNTDTVRTAKNVAENLGLTPAHAEMPFKAIPLTVPGDSDMPIAQLDANTPVTVTATPAEELEPFEQTQSIADQDMPTTSFMSRNTAEDQQENVHLEVWHAVSAITGEYLECKEVWVDEDPTVLLPAPRRSRMKKRMEFPPTLTANEMLLPQAFGLLPPESSLPPTPEESNITENLLNFE